MNAEQKAASESWRAQLSAYQEALQNELQQRIPQPTAASGRH